MPGASASSKLGHIERWPPFSSAQTASNLCHSCSPHGHAPSVSRDLGPSPKFSATVHAPSNRSAPGAFRSGSLSSRFTAYASLFDWLRGLVPTIEPQANLPDFVELSFAVQTLSILARRVCAARKRPGFVSAEPVSFGVPPRCEIRSI